MTVGRRSEPVCEEAGGKSKSVCEKARYEQDHSKKRELL